MSKFVNQIYPSLPHYIPLWSQFTSSYLLLFRRHIPPFSSFVPCWCELVARTLRWARTHFAKDNFPLCYEPTFPSLFPSLIPPLRGKSARAEYVRGGGFLRFSVTTFPLWRGLRGRFLLIFRHTPSYCLFLFLSPRNPLFAIFSLVVLYY